MSTVESGAFERLVVIGPPASGKGTQARRLAKLLGLRYLSTGALLREHMENGTPMGEFARPILDRGGYLPDDFMCEMVNEWLEEMPYHWVLDGFPRSRPQADFLQKWLSKWDIELHGAILLEAPLDILKGRIQDRVECPDCRWSGGEPELVKALCPECGGKAESRQDDSMENFLSRHEAYTKSALPLVEDYRLQGVLCACDATQPRDEVTTQLVSALDDLQ